jgi:ComF family protein
MRPSVKSFRALLDGALDLVFGSLCFLCREAARPGGGGLCESCSAAMAPIAGELCRVCGAPYDIGEEGACPGCRVEPRAFDSARAYTEYTGLARDAVLAFKYGGKPGLSRGIANLIADWAAAVVHEEGGDVLVPVPLHGARLKERGYNQAALLAARLAGPLGLPVDYATLRRLRPTARQSDLERADRFLNVKDAFGFSGTRPFEKRSVVLVDDVLTTGATASECAKAIKRGGAKRVLVLTFARTLGRDLAAGE